MLEAVLRFLPEASILIKTAAVADYTVSIPADEKLKRTGRMTLDLEPTVDILAEVARRRTSQIVIGFAAETQNVIENAKKKLAAKSLDAIVVNDVSKPGIGFDSDRNAVTILTASETTNVPETSKWEVGAAVAGPGHQAQTGKRSRIPSVILNRMPLDPALRRALTDRVRYYNDLGIYDFYRRTVTPEISDRVAQDLTRAKSNGALARCLGRSAPSCFPGGIPPHPEASTRRSRHRPPPHPRRPRGLHPLPPA
jgi:hypothetical protein